MTKIITKIVLLFVTALLVFSSCSIIYNRMTTNRYLDGYWGPQWKELNGSGYYGNPGRFVVYNHAYYGHPSEFSYRITINNYDDSSLSNGKWYVFSGAIEYHTVSAPSSYKEASRNFVKYNVETLSKGGNYSVTRSAQIKVHKDKNGYTYNVFFDDVGFGVTIPWPYAK